MTKPYRHKALDAKGKECQNCGATEEIEVHHRDTNRCNNDLGNLVVLCSDCHDTVHNGWPEKDSFLRDLKIDTKVRVPDPVYSKLSTEAERQDVARGVIVREWMEKSEKYEELEGRRR